MWLKARALALNLIRNLISKIKTQGVLWYAHRATLDRTDIVNCNQARKGKSSIS